MTEFVSLSVLFQSIYQSMCSGQYEALEEEQIWTLVEKIDSCHNLVRQEALFSKNETLEDVHTETMKVYCFDNMCVCVILCVIFSSVVSLSALLSCQVSNEYSRYGEEKSQPTSSKRLLRRILALMLVVWSSARV